MLNENIRTTLVSRSFHAQSEHGEQTTDSRYAHILVPTSQPDHDHPAFMLGVEIAAIHQSQLTVLHVPPFEPESSVHWLDAIDHLYRAADRINRLEPSRDHEAVKPEKLQIKQLLEKELPKPLRDTVFIRAEYRVGDFAEKVVTYANETSVDLIVMSARLPRWWLPIPPSSVRRVLRLMQQEIILVRPGKRKHNGFVSHVY
jgi:nucleotide-binding universal stress UspA family protein